MCLGCSSKSNDKVPVAKNKDAILKAFELEDFMTCLCSPM